MEIERKFTIKELPDLSRYPYHIMEQAYLNVAPVVRVRKEDDTYYLTYKGSGMLSREEYNLPLDKDSYYHLLEKADGTVISKKRYLIPYQEYTIELDVFDAPFAPLILAEVEFSSEEEAHTFLQPDWFLKDVTFEKEYHNSNMSRRIF
ncbi:MAG: CYTH domain-containing protein [Eubacteriales bacterium]